MNNKQQTNMVCNILSGNQRHTHLLTQTNKQTNTDKHTHKPNKLSLYEYLFDC